MAYLDHQEAFEDFKRNALKGIESHFPVTRGQQTIELEGLEVRDAEGASEDLKAQHTAKVEGGTFAAPVFASLVMKTKDGKVIQRKKMRVAEIPYVTKRYSYIVEGNEYQVDNQWQLKPGVYSRRNAKGELKSDFNTPNKKNFGIRFEPDTKKFLMSRGKSENIPVYPLMKAMGIDDDTLERKWGKDILEANKKARGVAGALDSFYKTDRRSAPISPGEAEEHFRQTMLESKLDPKVTEATLGKAKSFVDGDTLLRATDRMLKVQAGAPEDDRDSLEFKKLRSAGDFVHDRLTAFDTGKSIRGRMWRKLGGAKDIRDVVKFGMMNDPIKATFKSSELASIGSQINPLDMVSSAQQTTIMGSGGVQSENATRNMINTKLLNPSHLGFLDPVKTPEGPKTGIILRMPTGVRKIDGEAHVPLYNLRTGKDEYVSASKFAKASVVLPDQVTWKDGKPKPISSSVKMSAPGNELVDGKFNGADYTMRHPSQMFSLTTNLIPFMGSTSGNRATYAGTQMEQAISLKNREAPLVQVGTGSTDEATSSFEGIVGRQAGHVALAPGVITKITKDAVTIAGDDGKTRKVQLYNNFPLNEPKGVIHSDPSVVIGQKVAQGQTVADTNYTKNGKLALGTNLRVAYLPYKGYNFEDGVVISESAAKKLTSEHLHKQSLKLDSETVTDPRKFRVHHQGAFDQKQFGKLDDEGVIRVGQMVQPGDPLVLAMKPFKIRDQMSIGAVRKMLSSTHTDTSMRWSSDYPGKVVAIHKKKDGTTAVHVRTEEPMQVGDKLCYDGETEVLTDTGWVPIPEVGIDHKICTLVDGRITYQNPSDVVRYARGDRMYRIKSQQVDLFVTAEHQMYVQRRCSDVFELARASSIAGQRVRYKKDGLWEGSDPEGIAFPPMQVLAGQFGHGSRWLPEQQMPLRLFLVLLGAYLSNGHCVWDEEGGNYGLGIDKLRGSLEPLLEVLDEYSIKYSVQQSTRSRCDRVIIRGKQLASYFRGFGKALDKSIPSEVFSYSRGSLKVLFDWLMWGDGHVKGGRPVAYFTSSRTLADDVQRLALHVGIAANVSVKKEAGWQTIRGKQCWCARSYQVRMVTTKLTPMVNHGHTSNQSIQEEYFEEGYDKPVYCVSVPGHVLYVRRNGKSVWSGNSGRHGNKGIVTMIVPDAEMPKTRDGNHIQVALNPSGVPGRMNLGQVLETAAAKIAEKTGKTYVVNNFDNSNAVERVKADLKKHGLSDQEELVDPETGMSLGKALVGSQHMIKLVQQIDKKTSVRSGMASYPGEAAEKYDLNLIPSGSGKTGAQTVGHNGLYTLLAHGAKANIREMHTWKSEGPDRDTNLGRKWPSQHEQVWNALQTGDPLPTPKPTFAFKKFEDLLRGAGINLEKRGNEMKLLPFTDAQTLAMSRGKITEPGQVVDARIDRSTGELRARKGGLFDTKITGGHGGKGWGHIELPESVPNPVFERAIQNITGLSGKDYTSLATAAKSVTSTGRIVDLDTPGSVTGGAAIKVLLDKIDVKKELDKASRALQGSTIPEGVAHGASTAKVDGLVKKVKYLRTLDEMGVNPSEAYIIKNLPVIPPAMRPVTLLDGNVKAGDLTKLYGQLGQVTSQLGSASIQENLSDEGKRELRAEMYDGVKALMGMDAHKGDKTARGVMHQIGGVGTPKNGFFQQALLKRKTDMSMRSTIIPEPSLGLDEIGIPRSKALKLYQPFVVKKLVDIGAAPNVLAARKMVEEKDRAVWRALERVADERPVLVKRDPALHKHSIQAFKPRLVHGSAIRIHPLTTSGYNADFDGDQMSAYVPISNEAVKEARKMFPSANLFNEATGRVIYKPSLEMALGLFKVSRVGEDSKKTFSTNADAVRAVQSGQLTVNDMATIAGVKTTPGRVILASALPEPMQSKYLNVDKSALVDKKGLDTMFTDLAKNYKLEFGDAANRLKDLGNGATYGAIGIHHPDHKGVKAISVAENHGKERVYIPVPTHSLSLDDFAPDYVVRQKHVSIAQRSVNQINKSKLSKEEKEGQVIKAWSKAVDGMTDEHMKKMEKNPTNLALMAMAEVKPSKSQYRQMVLAPGLLEDASGKTIITPVIRSYSEGLDLAGYWTQSHGARGGTIKKVQEVEAPGVFSKRLMQVTMGTSVVASDDCGTERGLSMPVVDKSTGNNNRDVYDRVLAADFKSRGLYIPKGTIMSPDVVSKIRSVDKNAAPLVRSTLKCEHGKGVCQKCAGLSPDGTDYDLGTNLGVIAAQSLGERAIQLTLKAFHSGGVASGGGGAINKFDRVKELTNLYKTIPNSASLAMRSGTIEKVEHDATGANIWIGGKSHHVGKDTKGNPLYKPILSSSRWQAPRVGMKISAGDSLSDPGRTVVNPHDLYKATNSMERVQNFITDELHGIYKDEGVRRQHVETVVNSMGQLTKVRDSGDADGILKGDYANASKIRAINKVLQRLGKRPVEHSPILKGIEVTPLNVQEDWMAKMMHKGLKNTVVEAASMGSVSDLHGLHPVPAMAYAAEFGLNKSHSLKPGLGHLKDVEEYKY